MLVESRVAENQLLRGAGCRDAKQEALLVVLIFCGAKVDAIAAQSPPIRVPHEKVLAVAAREQSFGQTGHEHHGELPLPRLIDAQHVDDIAALVRGVQDSVLENGVESVEVLGQGGSFDSIVLQQFSRVAGRLGDGRNGISQASQLENARHRNGVVDGRKLEPRLLQRLCARGPFTRGDLLVAPVRD